MDSQGNSLRFDGQGDVKAFITKVALHCSLKGYTAEKKAQALASKLEGPAFDVYLRLSNEDKQKSEKIEAELLKEFERGRSNREEALSQLSGRKREHSESSQSFAYKLLELVKLAYPDFEKNTQETIAKDYFIAGLHNDMQVALKSLQDFHDKSLNKIAEETTCLELAGIQSLCLNNRACANAVTVNAVNNDIIQSIADKVIEKIQALSLSAPGGQQDEERVNFSGATSHRGRSSGYRPNFNSRRGQGNPCRGFRNPSAPKQQGNMRCRNCQSQEHLYRSCPVRFCQACGQRGHDAWDRSCANFQ